MSTSESSQQSVRAVDRALDILLCFSKTSEGLTLSEIAREVQLHKSTVHRLLSSLVAKGFVRKHPQSDKYLLGWTVLQLLNHIYQSDELSTAILPMMTRLRDMTSETVSLYIRSGTERIRIQSVESNEPVRNVATVGKTYPLYIGASGKVLLAHSAESVFEQVFQDPSIPKSLDKEDLRRQLETIRRDGYAISVQERDAGAAAIAVPVFGRNQFVAAVSVSGPVTRFTKTKMSGQIESVRHFASLMTQLLSH